MNKKFSEEVVALYSKGEAVTFIISIFIYAAKFYKYKY